MEIECVVTGVERRDRVLQLFAGVCGGRVTRKWDGKSIPAVVGFLEGATRIQVEARLKGIPFIFFDHGYFNRDQWLTKFRCCVNHYHCIDWRDGPKNPPDMKPWRKDGDTVLILPSHPTVLEVYGQAHWLEDSIEVLIKHTQKRVQVKRKEDGPLKEFLKECFAIVSFGSVSEVEAAIKGIPTFTMFGPTYPISNHDLRKIDSPIKPDRTQWARSLANSEWSLDEMPQVWERIKPCLARYGVDIV